MTQKLTAMIADGSYKAILDKWGLGANAVDPAHAECGARNEAAAALAEGFPDLSGMPVARQPHWLRWLSGGC